MTIGALHSCKNWLSSSSTIRWSGRVTQVVGSLVESSGPFCSVGDSCEVLNSDNEIFPGEIVAFRGSKVLSMCLDKPHGTRFGDRVVTCGGRSSLRVGPLLLGRVIDAKGQPLDSLPEYPAVRSIPVDVLAPAALDRTLIDEPLDRKSTRLNSSHFGISYAVF